MQLSDFDARVFSHEYDHIRGIPFIHWKISEGDIETKEEYNQEFDNLMYTIEYYKHRIIDEKFSQFNIYEKFNTPMLNENDPEKKFMIENELSFNNKLNFEELMLIDIEKAIKKDLKLKLQEGKKI